jgi:hypothetical protein
MAVAIFPLHGQIRERFEMPRHLQRCLDGALAAVRRFQQLLQILEQEEQVKRVRWAWLEIKLLVPAARILILCVHDQSANSRDVRSLRRPHLNGSRSLNGKRQGRRNQVGRAIAAIKELDNSRGDVKANDAPVGVDASRLWE